jgi:hypothetical protein
MAQQIACTSDLSMQCEIKKHLWTGKEKSFGKTVELSWLQTQGG